MSPSPTITIHLGHSPDPDDAFMWYPLADFPAGTGPGERTYQPRIDTGPFRFVHVLEDIQSLNQRAERGELEVTALSIHQYPHVADKYALTSCGSSMGDNYGPMVVTRGRSARGLSPVASPAMRPGTDPLSSRAPAQTGGQSLPPPRAAGGGTDPGHPAMTVQDLLRPQTIIAVPGERTTAFLALALLLREVARGLSLSASSARPMGTDPLSACAPAQTGGQSLSPAQAAGGGTDPAAPDPPAVPFRYHVVPFDQIIPAVAAGRYAAGLIIHEGQLTYAKAGLECVVDLGRWWTQTRKLPLPLGGNAIRRDLGPATMRQLCGVLHRSIEYALAHRDEAVAYALNYARDMGRDLADRFVGMYVNQWTLDYGEVGRAAVRQLLREGAAAGLMPDCGEIDFVEPR